MITKEFLLKCGFSSKQAEYFIKYDVDLVACDVHVTDDYLSCEYLPLECVLDKKEKLPFDHRFPLFL